MSPKMIFDVEANGLHGEGFAVGWVVFDDEVISQGYAACCLEKYDPWVQENVVPHLQFNCTSVKEVRDQFWMAWEQVRASGGSLWADCSWPVEANFLSACVSDDTSRQWNGPYPLHEIATVFELAGLDPTAKHDRLPNEIEHHPLGDAMQSARLLKECLKFFGEK